MTNFEKMKNENRTWTSPPFYTSRKGYKICLKVFPNGIGDGQGTHVSVYATLMKGEFDGDLTWPYGGAIKVQLLNQEQKCNHISEGIHFAGGRRVIQGELLLTKSEHPKFIGHDKLQPSYLKNDCLKLRINVLQC